ncbi:CinA family protein [Chloroflexota bacterium]
MAKEVGDLLRQRGLTLGVVESATGGLISHLITGVPGSSDYFKGAVTAYSNEVKVEMIGVREETIKRYGAVSHQVAEEMADGGRRLLAVDVCVADTGIAGPSGDTVGKPVGLFYLGLSYIKGTFSQQYNFSGERKSNRQSAAGAALNWLRAYLISLG